MRLASRYWPLILFLVLPAIPLWKTVFQGHSVGAFDQIRQMAPWFGPKPSQPWDVLQADSVLQFYPWRDLVLEAWSKGQLPLWNPYQLAGTPLLANSQSGGFYPPHILLGLLQVPTPFAIVLLAWLHLSLAGAGTYLLARRLGAEREGAAVGGAAFMLSAFMLSWTALPSVISTVSWIPWLLASVWAVCAQSNLRWLPLMAFSTVMLILAGHLQFVAYGLMAAVLLAAMAFVLAATKKQAKWTAFVGTVVAMGIGGAMSAPQLLPVLRYSEFSHRRNTPTEEGYQAYVASAIKPFELLTLPFALFQGNPREYSERDPNMSAYWPQYIKQGGNFAESAISIGSLVFALLFLAPWRDPRLWTVAALGAIALLLAVGTPLNKLLYFYAPGWSSTGSPGRVVVLFVLCSAVIAALALSRKKIDEPKSMRFFSIFLPAIITLPFVYLLAMSSFAPEGVDPQALKAFVMSSFVSGTPWLLFSVAVACGAIWLWKSDPPKQALVAAPILMALAYSGSIVMTGKPLDRPDFLSLDRETGPGEFERLAFTNEDWGLREAATALMPPNTPTIFRIHDIAGYDSLLHRETVRMLHDINGKDPAPLANGNMMFVKPSANLTELANAGVTWTVDQAGQGVVLDGLQSPGRVTGGRIVRQGFDFITLHPEGRKLVLRDRMMPGWMATADGRELAIAGEVWREVEVPEGARVVEMRYSPPGLETGAIIGVVGLLAFVAGTLLSIRSRPTPPNPDSSKVL